MGTPSSWFLDQPSISPKVLEKFQKKVRHINVKKGDILQQKGSMERKGYFVKKGLLRSYTIDHKGKEHIFMFAPEGWMMSDIEALALNTPNVLFIDALEDTDLEVIDERAFQEIMEKFPEFFSGNVGKLMKRIAILQRRVIMLMSATAFERYQEFIKTYPQIVQRVPQKMIASYLGVTPEALSKIRGEIARMMRS